MDIEVTLLPSLLMQIRTMVPREIKTMVERGPKEGREDVTLVTSLVTMQENAQIKGTLPDIITTTTIKTSEGMEIKGTTSSKERGRLPLIEMEMEIVNLSRGQGTPGMMNPMLLIIREMNIFLYLPSLLHLLSTPWITG